MTVSNRIRITAALALPVIIENILQIVIGVVDLYFVGRLGTDAIAAVGLTNLIMSLLIAVFSALSIGAGAMAARYIGAGEPSKLGIAIKHFALLGLLVGLFAAVCALLFLRFLLPAFSASEQMLAEAIPYFSIVAIPSVILCLTMLAGSIVRATGDTVTPMKIGLWSNILNIILTWTLVFGVFDLGIFGVGLGTTLARLIGLLLYIRVFITRPDVFQFSFSGSWTVQNDLMSRILKLSLPAGIERLIMRTGQLAYGYLIIQIGVEAYAAHNVAGNIESFSYLPGIGFGAAGAVLIGQQLGARQAEEARRFGNFAYLLGTGLMILIAFFFYMMAPQLAAIFSDDALVISQTVTVLRIIAFFQPFLAMTLITVALLQGAGDTRFPMYTTFFGIYVVRLIGTYVFGIMMGYGLTGVWAAYALDVTIRGTILMVRWQKGHWQNIAI